MASAGAVWGPATLRLLRVAVARTAKAVRVKVASVTRPFQGDLQHIPIRNTSSQPIHPAALLRQSRRQSRWFSSATAKNINSAVRRYLSSGQPVSRPPRFHRSKFPVSNTSKQVAQFTGRTPFASTLRPNLTGGAIPRTAGGYSIGGSARYFSHTPVAPAQVVQNVSQAMRAFMISGQKLRYDGVNAHGQSQYRAVSPVEDEAMRKLASIPTFTPGSFIDFQLNPTVTALSPLAAAISHAAGSKAEAVATATNLNTDGFLDILSSDFSRALQDLTAVFADLRRLSVLGDLPVEMPKGNLLRVRFPGVDAEVVKRLCDDLDIQRGVINQHVDLETSTGAVMAFMFPCAPDDEKTLTSPNLTTRSLIQHDFEELSSLEDDSFTQEAFVIEAPDNPWLSGAESYDSLSPPHSSEPDSYEGLEGIHRFIEACDQARNRFG